RGPQRLPPFIAARLRDETETGEEGTISLPVGTRPDHGDAQAWVSFAVVTDVSVQIRLMLVDPHSPAGGIDHAGVPAVGLVPDRRRDPLLLEHVRRGPGVAGQQYELRLAGRAPLRVSRRPVDADPAGAGAQQSEPVAGGGHRVAHAQFLQEGHHRLGIITEPVGVDGAFDRLHRSSSSVSRYAVRARSTHADKETPSSIARCLTARTSSGGRYTLHCTFGFAVIVEC